GAVQGAAFRGARGMAAELADIVRQGIGPEDVPRALFRPPESAVARVGDFLDETAPVERPGQQFVPLNMEPGAEVPPFTPLQQFAESEVGAGRADLGLTGRGKKPNVQCGQCYQDAASYLIEHPNPDAVL